MKPYVSKTPQMIVASLMSAMILFSASAQADDTKYRRVFDARTQTYTYVPDKTVGQKTRDILHKPVVKQGAIGAAAGLAAGALSDRSSAAKGAGIGALVGAGSGLLDSSKVLQGHPMVKSGIKGAAIGTGASVIFGKSALKGAAVGTAAGVGVQAVKDYMNKR